MTSTPSAACCDACDWQPRGGALTITASCRMVFASSNDNIARVRKENVFKEDMTEAERRIVEARVALQQERVRVRCSRRLCDDTIRS